MSKLTPREILTAGTVDVGRILESDVIVAFVGYGYPNIAPKGRLKT
ncbi:hypothetical protein RSJ68_07540 [Neisseria sp. DTU_2020_1000833_1_SI_GRL_NUU_006]|nr:hypothetical protein RSJ68_07540 [Neisseria sp. DTU_2020_1000833_1_SI_GRL_NUU_006]